MGASIERGIERAGVLGFPAAVITPAAPAPPVFRRPTFTPGFFITWILTLTALGTITAICLVGLVATTVFFLLGQGGLGAVLAFALTAVLLGRGWVGMVQTLRARLRRRDLSEPAALPDAFGALSPGLQRMVRHARSLTIVLDDPQTSPPQIDREIFEWLCAMERLPAPDLSYLAARGLSGPSLRAELLASRWSEDRERARPWWRRSAVRPGHHAVAIRMLVRFEQQVLRTGGDPFREGI